ncbi:ABC transporter ATP-binding protein [Thermosipho ferrireducens]|uniref:ABC transporter ATP-binding protein n=1 Tax=Thermosipho ferrireducens TaxID=2571116 RepID=A0ABX7S6S5_9BACT|nr:ATP-binding cassette domain-containing protein [Thermosipho ferrireducens]QTA38291.1 ABC transporter ATP-binding protein [Thermosipho ferrireducens]
MGKQKEKRILEVTNLTGYANKIKLFSDISFYLGVGESLVLYGPRGSGKSALLRTFVRLNEEVYDNVRYEGNVFLDGNDLFAINIKDLRNLVFYVDTNFLEALDYLRFDELLSLGLGESVDFEIEENAETLDDFGILKALRNGEKTRLSEFYILEKIELLLYLAYLKNSFLVIFDCIFDHLDDEHLQHISRTVKKKLLSENRSLIIATRFLKRFMPLSDLFIFMKNGKIKYKGEPKDFANVR